MTEEYTALVSNKTWLLVPRPLAANVINYILLFKKNLMWMGHYLDLKLVLWINDVASVPVLIVMRSLVLSLSPSPYTQFLPLLSLISGLLDNLM